MQESTARENVQPKSAVADQSADHGHIDLGVRVEEAEHQAVGADLTVGRGQPLQPNQLAAVGAEALAQPQHHPQRAAGHPAYLADQGRLG